MKISKIFEYVLSLPKSIYVSFRLVPIKEAIKLPILVRYNCCLISLKGSVVVSSGGGMAMLRVGFGEVGIFDKRYERSVLQIDGIVMLNGKCYLGHGARLCVTENGVLTIGNNYVNTAAGRILCSKRITIGDNVLVSWNTTIMDTDWHQIKNVISNEVYKESRDIFIGKNVWIGMGGIVLKGSIIPSGCIIAANAVVTKAFNNENSVLAGNPAVEKKHCVTLHRELI